jgi:hypothetical protein
MRYCVDQLILRLNNLVIVTLAELEIILNGEHRRIWKKAVAPTYLPTYLPPWHRISFEKSTVTQLVKE